MYIPCVSLDTFDLSFNMLFASNLVLEKGGLYWKLDASSLQLGKACGTKSCTLNSKLDLSFTCLEYAGTRYQCDLLYQGGMGDDPFGLYWQLDVDSLQLAK
jgi:hypothetical protein